MSVRKKSMIKKYKIISLSLCFILLSGCSYGVNLNLIDNLPKSIGSNHVDLESSNQSYEDANLYDKNDYKFITEDIPFDLNNLPEFSGQPYTYVNNNIPYFTDQDVTDTPFEQYSELDSIGRCGTAYANICIQLMPTEERSNISHIKPTGFVQNKYPNYVDSNPPYLYNRCHLIAFCLAGEQDNEKNLITGTRYLNTKGMLPFETSVANYVKLTGHHVLYRVTPIFIDDELLCRGVLIEAKSIEDDNCVFCVYCHNVQPGIKINYLTGENKIDIDYINDINPNDKKIL